MSIGLQCCGVCGAFQYPSRDLCRQCLSDALTVRHVEAAGRLLAEARICRSLEPERLAGGPLRIGAVALDAGVRVIAMLDEGVGAGDRVVLRHAGEFGRTMVAGLEQRTIG